MRKTLFLLFSFLLFNAITHSQVVINEFMASNIYTNADPLFAEYSDWIELYNNGATDVDISGYYLSDNVLIPLKWQIPVGTIIPAGDFLLLWADSYDTLYHANFSLSALGEQIFLYNPLGVILDSLTYFAQDAEISMGRYPNGTGNFEFFDIPTPNSTNNTQAYIGRAIPPDFVLQSGFFTSTTSVELIPNITNDTIYYTLDNTLPTASSTMYTGPISITSTTVIHAVSIRNGYINSKPASSIYYINVNHQLPVWAILTDHANLWGSSGLYDNPWGTTSKWEREVMNRYFVNDTLSFSLYSGLRIQGGNSVGMAKKSFREFYKGGYGDTHLIYPLFTFTGVNSFKNIVLRAGYDDDVSTASGTLLRDPLSSDLYRLSGGLASLSEWSVLYLNNSFWGVYNVRESINEYFIEDHTGYSNFDLIRYTKTGSELKWGDFNDWQTLTNFFSANDFTLDQTYYDAANFIDMDNFINLLAFVHCSQYRSWTWGCFAFKEKQPNAKWRWTMWDTDQAYKTLTWNGFTEYQYTYNEKWSNFMPKELIKNNIFKRKLINRTADLLNTLFLPDTSNFHLDSLASIIDPEMTNETARWGASYATWQSRVVTLGNFLNSRPSNVRSQILSYFALPAQQTIVLDTVGQGYIHLSTIDIKYFPWTGIYFEDVIIDITAIPNPGYIFAGWSDTSLADTSFVTINLTSTYNLTAYFIADTAQLQPLVINEINYNSSITFDSKDWIEIYNPNSQVVDISNWVLKDDNDLNIFTFPLNTFIDNYGYLIVCKDTMSFIALNPQVPDYIGNFIFGYGSTSDVVRLFDDTNTLVDYVAYFSYTPWPTEANGFGPTLELMYPYLNNAIYTSWVANTGYYGTPGEQNRILSIIEQSNNEPNINVFPNPFNDKAYIQIFTNKKDKPIIDIYNISGSKIKTISEPMSFSENIFIYELDAEDIEDNGLYIVRINIGNEIYYKKIILSYE